MLLLDRVVYAIVPLSSCAKKTWGIAAGMALLSCLEAETYVVILTFRHYFLLNVFVALLISSCNRRIVEADSYAISN